jgi:hypothetical protein
MRLVLMKNVPPEKRLGYVSPGEVGPAEVGPAEVDQAEIGTVEIDPAEVDLTEIQPDGPVLAVPRIPRLNALLQDLEMLRVRYRSRLPLLSLAVTIVCAPARATA